MVWLICEGACNPGRKHLEDRAHAALRPLVDPLLIKDLKGLVYTRHQMVEDITAQCLVCHTRRRYGSRSWALSA